MVGAAEDVGRTADYAFAKSSMDRAKLAGFDSIRITQTWTKDQTKLGASDEIVLDNAINAAQFTGLRVVLSLYPFGSSVTPLTDEQRADFASFAADVATRYPFVHDFIVGNEPNLNRFWLPQFNPDGTDAAAPAYEQFLASAYDALKAVRPRSTVYGGALAPRGVDKPNTGRDTHSPTAFITDLGAAYRASGRRLPIMDAFAFHPYPETSTTGPNVPHPNGTSIGLADYSRLVGLLGAAFDGTSQRGSTLPLLYDEFGIETQIPPAKALLYVGAEPATTKPVSEATAGAVLPPGDADDLLPADGARAHALPRPGRARPLRLAVRRVLRRRHAEDVAPAGPSRSLQRPAGDRRLVRRPAAHPEAEARRGQADEDRRAGDAHLLARLRLHGTPGRQEDAQRHGRRRGRQEAAVSRRSREGAALPRGHRNRRTERGATRPSHANVPAVNGQYVAYTFFRIDPAWRRLPVEERAAAKDGFAEVLEELAPRFDHLRTYSTTGVRPETDFFLWKITERYEDLGELGAALNGTPLAGWLETPYSYLATMKASQYTSARKARKITPKNLPYLVVYPFVKVRPWYSLTEDVRQRAMDEHIRIGREEFPGIFNHTTYSFGIDDAEFMTAFECEEPADFMHLMLRLRDSEASAYTERDTPIFVGQHMPIRAALDRLDGVGSLVVDEHR